MKYHMAAFVGGFLLDMVLGDPHTFPHPVRLLGRVIKGMEGWLLRGGEQSDRKKLCLGGCLVALVLLGTVIISAGLLAGSYLLHPYVGVAVETIMTYQILAAKCLQTESMKVCEALRQGDIEKARQAVSMIVGRDTACLNEEGIVKAAIETVAENTSDGVVAPMLYTALGGPVLGFLYKAVNTMDSMVGYKNERYLFFGRAAARLDDVANYLPARISAWLMIAVSFLAGKEYSGRRAVRVYRRDKRNHASPNSAQTEAVCAGALGLRLGGDAVYFGKAVKKPYIGDNLRRAEWVDIKRANKLMIVTALLWETICVAVMLWVQYCMM